MSTDESFVDDTEINMNKQRIIDRLRSFTFEHVKWVFLSTVAAVIIVFGLSFIVLLGYTIIDTIIQSKNFNVEVYEDMSRKTAHNLSYKVLGVSCTRPVGSFGYSSRTAECTIKVGTDKILLMECIKDQTACHIKKSLN